MSAQADAALSFDRAGFTYAGAREPALADVSLSVPAGQCVVLTGGSGCGKTTLTRLANGLIPVSYDGELAGSVRIAGKDAGSWEMDALCRRVGSVFQNPRSQFFNLDTTSEVAFGCENLGLSRAEMHRRVDGAFALLGIEHLRDRDIRALSGGQRQMVAIASVCAMGPDVFVLDEPTASLDVGAMLQLAEAVARLKAAGKQGAGVVVEVHESGHDEPASGVHICSAGVLAPQPGHRTQRKYQPVVTGGHAAAGHERLFGVAGQDGPAAYYDHLRLPP